jgi:hypothetical protein
LNLKGTRRLGALTPTIVLKIYTIVCHNYRNSKGLKNKMIKKILESGTKLLKTSSSFIMKLIFAILLITIFNSFVIDLNNEEILKWILGLIIFILWTISQLPNEIEKINEPLLEKMEECKEEIEELKDEIESLKKSLEPKRDCQWI